MLSIVLVLRNNRTWIEMLQILTRNLDWALATVLIAPQGILLRQSFFRLHCEHRLSLPIPVGFILLSDDFLPVYMVINILLFHCIWVFLLNSDCLRLKSEVLAYVVSWVMPGSSNP